MTHEHFEADPDSTAVEAALQAVTSDEARQIRGGNPAIVAFQVGLIVAVASHYINRALNAAEEYDRTKPLKDILPKVVDNLKKQHV